MLDSYEEIENQRNFANNSYLPLLDKYRQLRDIYKSNEKGSSHQSDFVGLFKNPLFENSRNN